MARPPLLTLQDIALTFGGTPLLSEATLMVSAGDRIALVGRNGSGKSTLLKIAAGLIDADSGDRFASPDATIRYLAQEPDLSAFATVGEYVATGLAEGDDPYAGIMALEALKLDPDASPAPMSGGEKRRAALAHALAPDPDVLLLDEPTNHLDIAAIAWLEATLRERRKALVLISHDRRFLEELSTATVWLDRGQTHRMDKGFTEFEDWRDEILNAEDEERRKLDKKIAAEQDWVRYGVTARRKRNMGRLRKLQSLRQERRDQRQATGLADMSLTGATRSGQRLFVAKNIAKAYDGRPIVADLSMTVMRGDKIGLVGPNGAGKTTLVNLLLGRLAPDSGSIKFGTDIEANYIDQTREGLDPEMPLRQAISPSGGDQITIGNSTKHVAGYLKDFLFSPEQFNTPVGALSGGERARVLLGRAFAMPANVLVLDEPTNDLDLETLDLLAEIIADYDGTLILVSHDRDFLDRTVTTTLVAEGDGQWGEYPGGYSDMVTQRGLPPVGDGPAPSSRSKKTRAEPAKPSKNKGKLSFREKHDLETLPGRVQEIEREVAKLGNELADPKLYAKNPKRFDKLTADIAKLEAEKAAAEERWLEVEMKREEMEGG
ncbi:ATP-binding cassette domain-containing protein [Acuticoccus sp. MNP-M23]|uniref:ABC-F family ATP-binding cassette domain-containing protein n=1 Tax=Acuticoccus sp. MNP-M23 TaxID=3072793 RepID=UPI002815C62E|nr:ATP-binding cassette domain-containing protein [Acuticoccus sp. MNP-M23]WMS43010.1 ATP-binding cassette domain-containing protein [Acuticoccus sp. MNP-M23]